MTTFTIIAYVMGLIVALSFLFGVISLIDGFVNKIQSKIKIGTVLLTVAVVLATFGGVKISKKIYKMRKFEIQLQYYENDLAYRQFKARECMMGMHEGMDSTCCPKKDSIMMKKCTPGGCENHTK